MLKLRAEIVIELQAADFVGAAEHQREMEALHQDIHTRYPNAVLHLRERRDRKVARRIHPSSPIDHQTGRVNDYLD